MFTYMRMPVCTAVIYSATTVPPTSVPPLTQKCDVQSVPFLSTQGKQ